MSISVTSDGRNGRNAASVTGNAERRPLTNAERQAQYRARRKAQTQRAQSPGIEHEPSTNANGTEQSNGATKTRTAERKPSVPYSEEIANIICARLEAGETLLSVCSSDDLPSEAAVRKWAADPAHSFSARYARAREVGYLKMADEVIALSDGLVPGANRFEPGVVQRHRLMVDSRKWLLSKVLPKVYGDKVDLTSGGKPLSVASDLDIAKALAHALSAPALPAPTVIDVEATEVPEDDAS